MSTFEIADCPTRLPVTQATDGNRVVQRGTLTVTVRNKAEQARTARIAVEIVGAAKPNWFSFEDALPSSPRELERDYSAKGTGTVRLNLTVPADEAPGSHVIRIRVTGEDDPDEDFTVGPNVAFDLQARAEQPRPQAENFPWWAIGVAAALVLLVVGGGTAIFLMRGPDVPPLIGVEAAAAERALKNVGLESSRTLVIVGEVGQSNGRVILSDPSSGERVSSGSTVKLFIGAPTNLYRCPSGNECVFFVNLPAETQKRIKENMN